MASLEVNMELLTRNFWLIYSHNALRRTSALNSLIHAVRITSIMHQHAVFTDEVRVGASNREIIHRLQPIGLDHLPDDRDSAVVAEQFIAACQFRQSRPAPVGDEE
jgi:hypothetical protein